MSANLPETYAQCCIGQCARHNIQYLIFNLVFDKDKVCKKHFVVFNVIFFHYKHDTLRHKKVKGK